MNWRNRLLFAANIALGAMFLYFIAFRQIAEPGDAWTRTDLVTIVLAAVAVELATLALFIGALAIWGYNTLQGMAERTADAAAREVARNVASSVALRTASAMFEVGGGAPEVSKALSEGNGP